MDTATEPDAVVSTQTITSNGCRLIINVRNDKAEGGPTLVMIHHWGGLSRLFDLLLRQRSVALLIAVTYHARGWYPSTGPEPEDSSKYGIPEMACDLENIVATTATYQHPRGFVLVAHSMGGKVAQYFASTCSGIQKQAVKGLLLVAPAPLRAFCMPGSIKKQRLAAYYDARIFNRAIRHAPLAREDSLNDDIINEMVEDGLRGSDAAKNAWPVYGSPSDFAHLQERISVPVLVLPGDKDWERDVDGQLGEDQGWTNLTISDCGHMIPLEQPKVLADHIEIFIREGGEGVVPLSDGKELADIFMDSLLNSDRLDEMSKIQVTINTLRKPLHMLSPLVLSMSGD